MGQDERQDVVTNTSQKCKYGILCTAVQASNRSICFNHFSNAAQLRLLLDLKNFFFLILGTFIHAL